MDRTLVCSPFAMVSHWNGGSFQHSFPLTINIELLLQYTSQILDNYGDSGHLLVRKK